MKCKSKFITMLLAIMLLVAIPGTMVTAVPKKSGIDATMSAKLTKAYNSRGYEYKGKKISYLRGLVEKWAKGKISKKTLIRKAESLKWTEKSYYPNSSGKYFTMSYRISSWGIECGSFSTRNTKVSKIKKAGMKSSALITGGNVLNIGVAFWNKAKKQYTVYYFGSTLN